MEREKETEKILTNKKFKSIMKKVLFSRLILFGLILLFQLSLYLLFILWLKPYFNLFLGSNVLIIFIFMIVLANSNGKNEFKIAWLVPVSIFPLFGVAMYLLYHTNGGGYKTKKKLLYLKNKTENLLQENQNHSERIKKYSEVEGISNFN